MWVPVEMLRELFDYNYWARDRQVEACRVLSIEQFRSPLGSSFPSLRDTLAHMVGAEWVWLERLQRRSPQRLPATEEFPTLEVVRERWRALEDGFSTYLNSLRDEQLSATITYTNFVGENWTYATGMILLHLINHQTYHRGQVSTLLRLLGVQPPAVDLLVADDWGLFRSSQSVGELS